MDERGRSSAENRAGSQDATVGDGAVSTGMVVLIVAGDRTTPGGQEDCTTIVKQLREAQWFGGVPPIHIVPDADTGRWLLRGMKPAADSEIPESPDRASATASADGTGDETKATWPFVERRRRTTDRRQCFAPYAGAHNRRSSGVGSQTRDEDRDQCTAVQCTEREEQIVKLVRQGLTNKEIAQRLGIVEDTVKKHLQHIYNKLGVRRRTLVMLKRTDLPAAAVMAGSISAT